MVGRFMDWITDIKLRYVMPFAYLVGLAVVTGLWSGNAWLSTDGMLASIEQVRGSTAGACHDPQALMRYQSSARDWNDRIIEYQNARDIRVVGSLLAPRHLFKMLSNYVNTRSVFK